MNDPTPIGKYPCFITKRANWSLFTQLTEAGPLHQFDSIKPFSDCVTAKLFAATSISIPRRSMQLNRPPVPWLSGQCDDAKRERDGPGGIYNCEIEMAKFVGVLKSCRVALALVMMR